MSGIGFKSGGYQSSTGWEKSHFGGHQRLIWDYPYVDIPDNVKMAPGKEPGNLQHYSASKLLKIFFMAAKDQGLAEHLFDQKTAEVVEVKSGFAWNAKVEPKIKLNATTEQLKKALPIICAAEPELAPLFAEYKDFILSSEFEILVDLPEDQQQGQGGKGEGKGEKSDKKEEGEKKEGEGSGEGESGEGEKKEGEGEGSGEGEKGEGEGESKGEGEGKKSDAQPKGSKEQSKSQGKKQSNIGGKGQGHASAGSKGGHYSDDISNVKDMTPQERQALAKKLIKEIGEHIIQSMIKKIVDEAKKGYQYNAASRGVTGISTGCSVKPHFKTVVPAISPAKMYQHEIMSANTLVNMLDISWESKSDIVKSLRMGKIDHSKIAEIPAGNMAVYQREMEDQDTKPFSICILVDESGSMGRTRPNELCEDNWDEKKERYYKAMSRGTSAYHLCKSLYHAFSQILPQDKMFIYGHSTGGPTGAQVYTYHDPYAQNFMKTVDDMIVRDKGSNYDGPVVDAVHQKVRSFTEDRIIFLVLSDGQPAGAGYGGAEDIKDFQRIVEKAKRDEFVSAGIFMQYAGNPSMYNYSTQIDDMEEMPKKVSLLLNKIVKTEFQ